MSENRLRSGNEPGLDCPDEWTFTEFIRVCTRDPIMRVQGRVEIPGFKLKRFNRSVRVLVNTARTVNGERMVTAERVRWNWRAKCFQTLTLADKITPITMTLKWSRLDWVTTQACNDPNGTWVKVTT